MKTTQVAIVLLALSMIFVSGALAQTPQLNNIENPVEHYQGQEAFWVWDCAFFKQKVVISHGSFGDPDGPVLHNERVLYTKTLVHSLNSPDGKGETPLEVHVIDSDLRGMLANHGSGHLQVEIFLGSDQSDPFRFHILTIMIEPETYVKIADLLDAEGYKQLLSAMKAHYKFDNMVARMVLTSKAPIDAKMTDIVIGSLCQAK